MSEKPLDVPTSGVMSERQAAAYLADIVSVHTLRRWRRQKRGPMFLRFGTVRVGYRVEDLDRYVKECLVPTDDQLPAYEAPSPRDRAKSTGHAAKAGPR
jgi:hypothetical protein